MVKDDSPANTDENKHKYAGDGGGGLSPKLLEMLVCPVSHAPLYHDRETNELISKKASLAYPIKGGIPIMLEAEARKIIYEK